MSDEEAHTGIDLAKELTCSICTDILYHPLTLLDCLHTFCGACLKEWFKAQASRATSIHPYTCPACRDSVRGTKHNATVSTLLDMFLQVNPTKGRTAEEKEEQDKTYKPGDNVLPKLRRKVRDRDREQDQRVLNEALAQSLEDDLLSADSRRSRDRSRTRRSSGGSNGSRSEGPLGLVVHSQPGRRGRTSPRQSPVQATPSRSMEHQSSLRSLLSASEPDIEEEIMRHIMEDGSLDNIDFHNLTVTQEDELSERIAQAYRRRQEEERRRREERRRADTGDRSEDERWRQHAERISSSNAERPRHRSRDAVSHDRMNVASNRAPRAIRSRSRSIIDSQTSLEPNRTEVRHRRRSESADVAPVARPAQTVSPSERSPRPRPSEQPAMPEATRSRTDPTNTMTLERSAQSHEVAEVPSHRAPARSGSDTIATLPTRNRVSPRVQASTFPLDHATPSPAPEPQPTVTPSGDTQTNAVLANVQPQLPRYAEPSISCRRCGKLHIEYDTHYACGKCDQSGYILCIRCYREGKGCLHWFGFRWSAAQRFEKTPIKENWPADQEAPHVLTAQRYCRPPPESIVQPQDGDAVQTTDDPALRLQSGVFCDICQDFANGWYWRCDVCNEGEWGFCNSCVNSSRHCTHPLLSLRFEDQQPSSTPSPVQSPADARGHRGLVPFPISTSCDICTYPIPPSNTRYHCPRCNGGDYDMHANCYVSLVRAGRIAPHDSHQGWRRCLRGHRMVFLGFEDRDGGQKRVVVRDLVGGAALREEDDGPVDTGERALDEPDAAAAASSAAAAGSPSEASASAPPDKRVWSWREDDGTVRNARVDDDDRMAGRGFPPDGGAGRRIVAGWSYYPREHVRDELMFPKGAEIKEVRDINGAWYWGVYAGSAGLFPGNYGYVVSWT